MALLIVLSWATVIVPRLVQSLTADKYRALVGSGGSEYSALASLSNLALTAALGGWCGLVVLSRLRNLPRSGYLPLIVMLAPWFYLAARDLYQDRLPTTQAVLYPAVVLAVWVLRPRLAELSVLGYLTGFTAMISILLAVLTPEAGIYRNAFGFFIQPEKLLLPWGVLVGPFTDGNNLGQFLVLGLPAVAFVRSRPAQALILALTITALVWSSSRSSMGALAAAAAVVVGAAVLAPASRRLLTAVPMTLAAATVAALPLLTTRDDVFTNRGYIWRISVDAWAERPAFGHGTTWYSDIGRYANALGGYAFHGHNQVVHSLVVGGLAYAGLLLVLVLTLIRSAARWSALGAQQPAAFVTALLATSLLEVSLGFVDRSFLLAVTAVPMAFILFGLQENGRPADRDVRRRPAARAVATTRSGSFPARVGPAPSW